MPITDPDWVPMIEATFDPGKPARSEQAVAFAGNPIAIALGKPGAPRLYGKAAVPRPQQSELQPLTMAASDAFPVDNLHYSGGFVTIWSSATNFISAGSLTSVLINGSVRLGATVSLNSLYARILKNGAVIQTFTVSLFALPHQQGEPPNPKIPETISIDVSVVVGDVLEWQVAAISNNATGIFDTHTMRSSEAYLRIGIPIKASDT